MGLALHITQSRPTEVLKDSALVNNVIKMVAIFNRSVIFRSGEITEYLALKSNCHISLFMWIGVFRFGC